MCGISSVVFAAKNLRESEIRSRRVLEVGSCDVNGSASSIFKSWAPSVYIGVDIEKGPCVDVVCRVENILDKFGKNNFDVVISTELLEHVKDWRRAISNMKNVCRLGGVILITTRSRGFYFHPSPEDYWRFEASDMKKIFSDCEILSLESDPEMPGIFIKVRKPENFRENDLSNLKAYCIINNRRIKNIASRDKWNPFFIYNLFKFKAAKFILYFGRKIFLGK